MVKRQHIGLLLKTVLSLCLGIFLFVGSSTISFAAITIPPQQPPTVMETLTSFLEQTVASFEKSVVSLIALVLPPKNTYSMGSAKNSKTDLSVLAATNAQIPQQGILPQQLSITSLPSAAINLLHNSSFEEQSNGSPRDWNYQLDSNTGNTFISPEGNRSGVYGLKFVGGGSGNFGVSQPNVKTIPGRTYTFSIYVKTTNTPVSTSIRFGFWNEYTNKEGEMKTVPLPTTADWVRYSETVTTPGVLTDAKNEFPLIEIEGETAGAVYLDDLELTEGSIPLVYNTNNAYNASYGIGDGSLIFSPGADIYPSYPGTGSLGSPTSQFQALNLTNADIDANGNFLFKGGGTINGGLTLGSLTINGNSLFSGTQSALPVINGGTGAGNFTQYGVLYGNGTSAIQALTPGTSGYILQTNGTSSAPTWVAVSSITSGNASQLLGATWAAPGTIGSTTPNTGAFTTLTTTGNLGVGVSSPSYAVDVTGTIRTSNNIFLSGGNGHGLFFTDGSIFNYGISRNSSGMLAFRSASTTDQDVIDNSGNFGIGITAPTASLDIAGNASLSGNLTFRGGGAQQVNLLNNSTLSFLTSVGGDTGVNTATPALYIASNGNIGFGTNSLGSSGITLASGYGINPSSTDTIGLGTKSKEFQGLFGSVGHFQRGIEVGTNTLISGSNNTNLGTTPIATLSAQSSFAALVVDNSGVGDIFTASTAGSPRFSLDSNGGVNLFSSTGNKWTAGTFGTSNLYLGRDITSASGAEFGVTGSYAFTQAQAAFRAQGSTFTNYVRMYNNDTNGIIDTSGSQNLLLQPGGNIGIGTTTAGSFKLQVAGNVGPDATDTYNLGSSSLEWNNLYVKNIISSATSGTNGFWQLNSGALSPANITNDLIVGATSTSSAKFGLINVAGGTPTATISGNFALEVPTTVSQPIVLGALNGDSFKFQTSVGGDTGLATKLFIANGGNIGVNTISPTTNFDVNGTASVSGALFFDKGSSDAQLGVLNGFGLKLQTSVGGDSSTSTRLYIANAGNVGVNTLTPSARFDVNGTASISGQLALYGTPTIQSTANQTLVVGGNTTGDIQFKPGNSTSSLYLASSGSVGIGTTTPGDALDVNGNAAVLSLQSTDSISAFNYTAKLAYDSSFLGLSNDFRLRLGGNSNPSGFGISDFNTAFRFWVNRTGGVGINTTSPVGALDVQALNGTTSVASISGATSIASLIVDNSGVGDIFTASSSGQSRFVITQNGNVGVGTTTPITNLEVDDPAAATLRIAGTGTSSTGSLQLVSKNSGGTSKFAAINLTSGGTLNFSTNGLTSPRISIDPKGNVGINALNQVENATLDVQANVGTLAIASISGQTSFAALTVDNSGVGDIFTASSSGLNRFVITQAGNVGIGTTTPSDKLQITGGNIVLGAQTDASSSAYTTLMSAAGTFGAQTSVQAATSSAVYKGKLFIATKNVGNAGVYRFDGGTTWTLVTHAAGQAVTGDSANSISGYSMVVYDNKLFIGSQTTQGTGKAAVYMSNNADTTADSFNLVSNSQGLMVTGGTSSIDAIDSMAVYNGELYVLTGKVNAGELYKYNGGTGASVFTVINSNPGQLAGATDFVCGGILIPYDGNLLVATKTVGAASAGIYEWLGNYGVAAPFNIINATRGRFDSTVNMQDVTAATVHNGELYFAATKGNGTAEVYRLNMGANLITGKSTMAVQLNATASKIDPTVDITASNIRAVTSMVSYNGKLFLATDTTGNGGAALYQLNSNSTNFFTVTLLGSNKGVYASDTGISAVDTMQEFNGTLYIGTDQANKGSVYTWTNTANNSYALKFDSGYTNANYGTISFVGSSNTDSDNNHTGSFLFSHAISLASGGFDYAEDYPTNDTSLLPGEIVAVDPQTPGYVKRADQISSVIGIISENPGFDLKQSANNIQGATYVPVALNGRVPVKVSTEAGIIKPGDLLTISPTTPGVAVKAVKPGFTIGRSLEGYTTSGIGKVTVFVSLSWADPSLQVALTQNGDMSINGSALGNNPPLQTPGFTTAGNATIATSLTGTSDATVSAAQTSLLPSISLLQSQIASISSQMSKIDDLSQKLGDLEKTVSLTSFSSTASALGESGNISGSLTVLGRSVLTDVGITGTVTAGLLTINGLDTTLATPSATINTLTAPLMIQSLAAEAVDFENGKVQIDTEGNITTKGIVRAKKYTVDTSDAKAASVGQAVIPAGQTSIEIKTTSVTDTSSIFTSPQEALDFSIGITDQKQGLSFTARIPKPSESDIRFKWWIIN